MGLSWLFAHLFLILFLLATFYCKPSEFVPLLSLLRIGLMIPWNASQSSKWRIMWQCTSKSDVPSSTYILADKVHWLAHALWLFVLLISLIKWAEIQIVWMIALVLVCHCLCSFTDTGTGTGAGMMTEFLKASSLAKLLHLYSNSGISIFMHKVNLYSGSPMWAFACVFIVSANFFSCVCASSSNALKDKSAFPKWYVYTLMEPSSSNSSIVDYSRRLETEYFGGLL